MLAPGTSVTLLAYLLAGVILYGDFRRRGLNTRGMFYISASCLFGAAVGAKIAAALGAEKIANPLALLLSGRSILGGVAGGWLGVELTKKRLGIRRSTGDSFALAAAGGESIGRLGCWLNGCCYGLPTKVPWAIYQHDAWRHPTQLYSSLAALLIFAALLYIRPHLRREGDLFKVYLLLFGLARFVIEFWRFGERLSLGLTLAQWISLGLGLAMLWYFGRGRRSAAMKLAVEPAGRCADAGPVLVAERGGS